MLRDQIVQWNVMGLDRDLPIWNDLKIIGYAADDTFCTDMWKELVIITGAIANPVAEDVENNTWGQN